MPWTMIIFHDCGVAVQGRACVHEALAGVQEGVAYVEQGVHWGLSCIQGGPACEEHSKDSLVGEILG